MYSFKSEVEYQDYDRQTVYQTIVNWGMEMELTDYGVKDLGPFVLDQTIYVERCYVNEETDCETIERVEVKLTDVQVKTDTASECTSLVLIVIEKVNGKYVAVFGS